jgi:hypothetical protein
METKQVFLPSTGVVEACGMIRIVTKMCQQKIVSMVDPITLYNRRLDI